MSIRSRFRRITVIATSLALAIGLVPATAAYAADDASLQVRKSVVGEQTQFGPGSTFQYEIVIGCSSIISPTCVNAVLADALPAPLIFDPAASNPVTATSSPAGPVNITLDGSNGFTATPGPGSAGLPAGGSITFTVRVKVPDDIAGTWNGVTVTNEALADADNAPASTSSADISLKVDTTLVPSLTKTGSPATVPAVPGKNVDWTLTPGNASNQNVDTIVVQDPATPPSTTPYLQTTGLDVVDPAGTTSRTVQYFIDGAWVNAPPGDAPPAGADVRGVRVVFTGTFAPGAKGSVVVHNVTTDAVKGIPADATEKVVNTASSTVSVGGQTSAPVTKDASVDIANRAPDVTIAKSFADNTLVSGQSTTATITATNGAQNVHELTVTEPSAGKPGFTAQGLHFDGFGAVQWPVAAASATITYTYSGCTPTTETLSTTTADTLPAPREGCVVEGYAVTYTADGDGIAARSYASLPMDVTALPVTTIEPVTSTNFTDTAVVNTDGAGGDAATSAGFSIDPLRVDTEVSKSITPDQPIYGVPGADANVSLAAAVSRTSTVGSTSLIISDPVDPTTPSEFWQNFTASDISNTDIPECSSLTVRYWSITKGKWIDLPGATAVEGPVAKWGYTIPTDISEDLGGIQFQFDPTCAETLPPGFNVITNVGVEVTQPHDEKTTYTNDVQSAVHNDDAIVPDVTHTASDDVTVIPVTGDGPDYVDKKWLTSTVPALSAENRTTRLSWSTQGLKLTSMNLTDMAAGTENAAVSTSVYDAFDLVRIAPISTDSDPLIADDVISKVELFMGGTWKDITADVCANGCTGQFGGYTLSTAQSAAATGVRITITERTAGAGIGSSYGNTRPLDLEWRIRDTLRSNPVQFVLGSYHSYTYNTGGAGQVSNTVSARGQNPSIDYDSTARDADTITIIDSPVNVNLTKEFDQDVIGLPGAGVAPENYPLISATLQATNTSAAKVSSMQIDDPAATATTPTAFDVLDLHSIDTITRPSGITVAQTRVILDRSGTATTYSVADALALTADDLRDVTGISVAFGDPAISPVIPSSAKGTVGLTWQLRQNKRSGGPVVATDPGGVPIKNVAGVSLDSPGRITTGPGASSGTTVADDSFNIVAAGYAISTTKSINPTSVLENGSKNYTTTLTAQPNGNARTVLMTTVDDTATFWNTMNFTGASIVVPRPVNQLAMDVLVDDDATRDITWNLTGGTLSMLCNGQPSTPVSPCWVVQQWTQVTPGSALTFGLPTGVSADQVVGVRFRARQVEGGAVVQWERPYNPKLSYALHTVRRDTVRSDPSLEVSTDRPDLQPNPGEAARGVISNTVRTHGDAQFGPSQTFTDDQSSSASTTVVHLKNAVAVTKTRGSQPTVDASGNVNYKISVENLGTWDMTGFHVVDQITPVDGSSPLVEPSPAAYSFKVTGDGAPSGSAGFSASLDPATGTITIVNSNPAFVFKAGWTLTVTADLAFRPGLSPDTRVDNAVTVTSDRAFETCASTTTDLVKKPDASNVASCTADTAVYPRSSAIVSLQKWVKGNAAGDPATGRDDLGVLNVAGGGGTVCAAEGTGVSADGFYSYPCAPITRPGGAETWRLDFRNTGNVNAKVLAAVDTLPAVNDQGVIVAGGRGSEFAVSLIGKVRTNVSMLPFGEVATVSAFYSTKVLNATCNTNAIKVHTDGTAPNPACAFDWTPFTDQTPESQLATARSVKFVVSWSGAGTPGLEPGKTFQLSFDTRTPSVLPAQSANTTRPPVAYNSFAAASRSVATSTQPERPMAFPLEPQRVPVATATGQFPIVKTVVAPTFSGNVTLPASYPFRVSCTSNGQKVTLLTATGADASIIRVPGDGSTVVFDSASAPVNLPLFSQCSIAESPAPPGVQVTISPSGTVMADRDMTTNPSILDGYRGSLANSRIDVTNTFTAGGFTVSKSVDDGGAVDQNGTPIVYDEAFTFRATCLYLGQETLATADRTFTLEAGQTKTVTGIPTAASCIVTETGAGGAASTTVTLTGAGGDPVTSTGRSVTFPIVAGADPAITAAFRNVYSVGAIAITKQVTGDGATQWGQGPFTVNVVCTSPAATPQKVYEKSFEFAPGQTVRIENLPTGATCTVTETSNGGANWSSGPIALVVGSSNTTPVEYTITNMFTTGTLRVDKTLSGAPANGLSPATDAQYEVSLACTRVVNGDTVDVAIPGGATRTIIGSGSARYQGLPTGASCALTETDAGFATSHTISPEGPYTIGEGTTPVVVSLKNEFANGSLQVLKTVDAPDGFPVPASFTATVTCTWHDAPVPLANGGVVTVTPGTPVTVSDIPIGSICAVAEQDAGQVETNLTPTSVTVTSTTQTVQLGIENVYEWAALRIGKVVQSNTSEVPTGFAFHTVCTFQGETVLDSTVTLDAGETTTYQQLPARAECTVVETDDRGADGTVTSAHVAGATGELAPTIDQETRTVVIPELAPGEVSDAANTVTYTNLYGTSALVVTKQFEGAGAAQFGEDKTFTAHVVCVYADESIVDRQLELNAENGFTQTITDVVAGADCTVTEPDLQGADAVVITPNDGEDTATGSVRIPAEGGAVTVDVTNWYLTGSLEVTKAFAGDGAEKYGTSDFSLQLVCVRDGVDVTIPDGDTRVVNAGSPVARYENLPTGAECTLREVESGGANSTAIVDAEGATVADDAAAGYTFTVVTDPTILSVDDQTQPALGVQNTFNLAQVSVTKAVQTDAVDADGAPIVYGPFEVELSCTWNGGEVTAAEDMEREIADGETVTWTELPEGAECAVTETDTAGASSTTVVVTEGGTADDPVDGTVAELAPLPNTSAEDQTAVAITNVFDAAPLVISKIVDGTAAGTVTRTFPIDVRCVLVDPSHPDPGLVVLDQTYQVGGPQRLAATIENLPVGATCAVTETDAGGANLTTVSVDGEKTTGTTVTVVVGSAASIVFTNTFIAPLPSTGGTFGWLVPLLAVLLLGGGGVLLMVTRRRRRTV